MFDFKKFPAMLSYKRFSRDNHTILERQVIIYGYLCDKQLIAVQELDTVNDVFILPVHIFEERFKDYKVIEDAKD